MKTLIRNLKVVAMAAMAFCAFGAWAESVKYIDADGKEQTVDATVVVGSNARSTLSTGWNVVKGEVAIPKGVDCSGDVNLILADGAKLTIDGVTTQYSSLEKALKAAQKGTDAKPATVKLLRNVKLKNSIELKNSVE